MGKIIAILLALYFLTQGSAMSARAGRDSIERGIMGYVKGYDCSSLTANTKLKLTAKQAAQLRDLSQKYTQETQTIREQLHNKGHKLKAEWLQTEPDRSRIEVMQGEAAKLQGQMRAKLAAYRTNVLKILTREQQEHIPHDGH